MPVQDPRGDALRVHIDHSQPLPDPSRYLHPPCFDADNNPVFFGSATLGDTIQPCKVTLMADGVVCAVPHRLVERIHKGPITVLPFTDAMELVPTSHGLIPVGCRPVVGGKDESGRLLYHAVAWVRGERVPGRTSKHLGAAAVLLGGREHYVYDAHEILCWRNDGVAFSPSENPPEDVIPDESNDQRRGTSPRSDRTRPVDKDLAGTNLRVTVSDFFTVTPYPASTDLDGTTPLYFGSAILPGEVIPCKVVQTRMCQVLHNDAVVERSAGFSILPLNADMELVQTSLGVVPQGRRPVEGNYDTQGRKLYHAMLYVVGRRFPGMCAEHLGGAQGVLQGKKYALETGYTILCWKEHASSSPASSADVLRHCSYKDDLAGQLLRKPLNGNEALTTTMAQIFGEHISNELNKFQWYFASVLHEGSVVPCWAYPAEKPCSFACDDTAVIAYTGQYCVLPFLRDRMVLVPAASGKVPAGTTPVEGGKDKEGRLLYHAVGWVSDSGSRAQMIGMAAEHLGGAVIVCWRKVHKMSSGYELL